MIHTSTETYNPPARTAKYPPALERPELTDDQDRELARRIEPYAERPLLPTAYPEDRERPRGAWPSVVQKFERYETLTGNAGDAGTPALIGTFSGRPDNIDLVVEGAVDIHFKLTDRTDREESILMVNGGQLYRTQISRERVYAERVTGAGAVHVVAVGKWAEPNNGDTR